MLLTPERLVRMARLRDVDFVLGAQLDADRVDATVLYHATAWDGAANTAATRVVGVRLPSGEPTGSTTIVSMNAALSSPSLSSNGTYVFSIGGVGQREVWVSDAASCGISACIASLPVPIADLRAVHSSSVIPTPDGCYLQLLAFTAGVAMDCGVALSFADTSDRIKLKPSVLSFDSLPVRHWDTWDAYASTNHVFIVAAVRDATGKWTVGDALDIMPAHAADCPTKPFGDGADFALNDDATMCVFLSRPPRDRASLAWSTAINLHVVRDLPARAVMENALAHAASPGVRVVGRMTAPVRPPVQLEGQAPSMHSSPSFSPDGVWIAGTAMTRPGYEADAFIPVLWYAATGARVDLFPPLPTGAQIDTGVTDLRWSHATRVPNGYTMYALTATADIGARLRACTICFQSRGSAAANDVRVHVVDAPQSLSRIRTMHARLMDGGLDLTLLASAQSMTSAAEVITLRVHVPLTGMSDTRVRHSYPFTDGWTAPAPRDDDVSTALDWPLVPLVSPMFALSRINDATSMTLPAPESLWTRGAHGDAVHSWVIPPAGLAEGARAPVAVLIHGGPQGNWGDDWHFRWNPQIWACAGYAVLAINWHGSTSFGQEYTDSIRNDWGGAPYDDIMTVLAHALSRYAYMDAGRVVALGASFGGYMINWMQGQDGARAAFKAFVNHDGIFDTRMFAYSTEELWFPEWDFQGPPFERAEMYEKWNPAVHVHTWSVPMLVIHGALDYRIGEADGIAAFTALQRRGVPSRFLFFPDEGHWVNKPANSLRWHAEVLGWLQKFVGSA